jgi:predicted AlkP superfamily phosphohydrolase/phosphomutase
MAEASERKPTRRKFLKTAALAGAGLGAAGLGAAGIYSGCVNRVSRAAGKKVIVIGVDGMDPRLSEEMMRDGQLPNLAKLRAAGGFSPLGTSIPPQSPVAWANFINGAGPGSHGIFDFIHRHPENISSPFLSFAETIPGEGGWEVGDHKIPLDFWPFKHKPPGTVLRRQGVPFWEYLEDAGVPSTFYDLPSNYPPSPSKCGHHRCLCGMGTPDMLGSSGSYQYFAEDGPPETVREQGGRRRKVSFEGDKAIINLVGPDNTLLKKPEATDLEITVHRDRETNAAVLVIGEKRVVLKPGQWSKWTRLEFDLRTPAFLPTKTVNGIARFYLQEVAPNFRLYVSPINVNPAEPVSQISEPKSFAPDLASALGPFATTGFKEDYSARRNNIFNDDEYLKQATHVLEERLALFEHAVQNYDDGLLFFYFSSSDLQSHMFWWQGEEEHPSRPPEQAAHCFGHVKKLYQRLDAVIGDLYDRYGAVATIIVMSDHGFANFGWQFNLNTWLLQNGYVFPGGCTSVLGEVDWSETKAYGLGINGLYLNLKGREPHGCVEPGREAEELIEALTTRLLRVEWLDKPVIRNVYRASQVYFGSAGALAPDLIVGYHRGFRASWATCLGDMDPTGEAITPNKEAWSADHCADALEVPGVMWCSKPIRGQNPALVDVAPSILAEYGLDTPATMTGRNVIG